MNLNKTMARIALTGVITAGVCSSLLNPFPNARAAAEPAPPAEAPKTAPASAFPETDPAKVVITVGGEKVTAGEVNALFKDLDPSVQAQVVSQPNGRREFADHFIRIKLMAAEARRRKLDETAMFKAEYEQLLGKALVYQVTTDTKGNEKFFADHAAEFEQVNARHILVTFAGSGIGVVKRTEAEAKAKASEIKARLDKGADFDIIARNESDDAGSAPAGGSLGLFGHGQMVQPFEKAVFALKDNQISEPIRTQYGYHIIQVLSHSMPTYESVAKNVPNRRMELIVEDMKKAAKPVLDEAFFGLANDSKADAGKTPAPCPDAFQGTAPKPAPSGK